MKLKIFGLGGVIRDSWLFFFGQERKNYCVTFLKVPSRVKHEKSEKYKSQ